MDFDEIRFQHMESLYIQKHLWIRFGEYVSKGNEIRCRLKTLYISDFFFIIIIPRIPMNKFKCRVKERE